MSFSVERIFCRTCIVTARSQQGIVVDIHWVEYLPVNIKLSIVLFYFITGVN